MKINTQQDIKAIMLDLMKALETLAPHPSNPDYMGPVFVDIDAQFTPPADYEGMGGSLLLEGLLSTAFSEALNTSNAAELGSQYLQDRTAKTSYKLGQKNVLGGAFNTRSKVDVLMKAYMADLPRRQAIERSLAHYQRFYYSLEKRARQHATLALAA